MTSESDKGSWAREVEENLFSPRVRIVVEGVEGVEVADEAKATATVKEQNGKTSRVSLVKLGGDWRVRSVEPA